MKPRGNGPLRRELPAAAGDRLGTMHGSNRRAGWSPRGWLRPFQEGLNALNTLLRPLGEWAWLRPIRLALGIVACADVRVWVSRYLDGDLTPRRLREVRMHLWGCRHCYSRVEFVRLLREVEAREFAAARAPRTLRRRILARLSA